MTIPERWAATRYGWVIAIALVAAICLATSLIDPHTGYEWKQAHGKRTFVMFIDGMNFSAGPRHLDISDGTTAGIYYAAAATIIATGIRSISLRKPLFRPDLALTFAASYLFSVILWAAYYLTWTYTNWFNLRTNPSVSALFDDFDFALFTLILVAMTLVFSALAFPNRLTFSTHD